MNFLCRIGWHDWLFVKTYGTHVDYEDGGGRWGVWTYRDRYACSRCGKSEDRNPEQGE